MRFASGIALAMSAAIVVSAGQTPTLTDLTRLIVDATRAKPLAIDWIGAERIWREAKGIPTPVSVAGSRTASIASGP